jgi:NADH-quinone oxidoreductase subunit C
MNLDSLRKRFGSEILEERIFRAEVTLIIERESVLDICMYLREEKDLAFEILVDLCGLDVFPAEPRFQVVYHLYSPRHGRRLRLKAMLPDTAVVIDSVVSVWEAADWHERECYDLFGIIFRNHPDLRRILLPEDFEGHPLRKDFPLGGRQ